MRGQVATLTEIMKSGFAQAGTGAPQSWKEGMVETGNDIYLVIISQDL